MSWLALSAECTLVDLSSGIRQAPCSSDADCTVLNIPLGPNFDPCKPFSCGARAFCEQGSLDSDHDGYVPPLCEHDPKRQDCDDSKPAVHPGATEICDNIDNDCDGFVDEGVLTQEQTLALSFPDAQPASDIAYAVDTDRKLLAVGELLAKPNGAAVEAFNYDDTGTAQVRPLLFDGQITPALLTIGVGLSTLADASLAAYSNELSGHLVVGALNTMSGMVSMSGSVAAHGLHCAPGEACANEALNAESPSETPYSEAPALSNGVDGTLVVYRRNPKHIRSLCGAQDATSAQPVLANLLARVPSGLSELTHNALQVAVSAQAGAPALMGFPAPTNSTPAFGWLFAYPDTRNVLQLTRIAFNGEMLEVSAPLLSLASRDGPLLAPQLTYGGSFTSFANHVLIGLVAQRGCGDNGRIVFAQIEAVLDERSGGVELTLRTPLTELGGDSQQHGASLAYRPGIYTPGRAGDGASWAVAFRDASGVRTRVVAATGVPMGDAPYLLMNTAVLSGATAETTAIVPLSDQLRSFAVYSYAPPDTMSSGGLLRTALGCVATTVSVDLGPLPVSAGAKQ